MYLIRSMWIKPQGRHTSKNADGYQVLKCDEDFNLVHSYLILKRRGGMYCDCPYGQAPAHRRTDVCRHVKMVDIFKKAKAIDKGRFYCYGTQEWFSA